MSVNTALFEGGTLTTIDSEEVAPAAGWTIDYASVIRSGSLVAVHIEVNFAAAAAEVVTKLGPLYAPGATVTSSNGLFTIGADGTVTHVGSTAAAGGAVCEFVYHAGVPSP